MEQKFDQKGRAVPITILNAPKGVVFQLKSEESDGYNAIQLGVGSKTKSKTKKPIEGRVDKVAGSIPELFFECLVDDKDLVNFKIGQEITIDSLFKSGDRVNVQAKSKGRGFAGAIKRWGFHSQPKTHGQSDRERAPGSIGSQTPGRVLKGKKMPGHFGSRLTTVKNLPVLKVDGKNNQIYLGGSVPGAINDWVLITLSKNSKNKKVVI